jgi:hypothetical protein
MERSDRNEKKNRPLSFAMHFFALHLAFALQLAFADRQRDGKSNDYDVDGIKGGKSDVYGVVSRTDTTLCIIP